MKDIAKLTRDERRQAFLDRDYDIENMMALLSDFSDEEKLDLVVERCAKEIECLPNNPDAWRIARNLREIISKNA